MGGVSLSAWLVKKNSGVQRRNQTKRFYNLYGGNHLCIKPFSFLVLLHSLPYLRQMRVLLKTAPGRPADAARCLTRRLSNRAVLMLSIEVSRRLTTGRNRYRLTMTA